MMGLALTLLALPLGGFGGASHTTESAFAANGRQVTYTVRAGDTLWSIAQRADPNGDPRPMVSRLAAQIGGDTVVPGEQLTIP
jgi:nucleoid-associated protein YgaU